MQKPIQEFDAEERELALILDARKSSCPPYDVLLAVGQDVLPAEVEEAAAKHVAACMLCSGLIADFTALPESNVIALEQKRIKSRLISVEKHPGANWRLLFAIAAVLAVTVTGIITWRNHRVEPAQTAKQSNTQSATTQTVSAELSIPLAPLAPPTSAAVVTRGEGEKGDPSTAELLPAFTSYNHSDYATAAKRFQALAHNYPKSSLIHLYLGVSELFLNENQKAQDDLRLSETTSTFSGTKNAALWYQAIAANRLHSPETKLLLQQLCDNKDSVYSEQSCYLRHMQ